jgi:imidazolonepropionase-like amidohydrolase
MKRLLVLFFICLLFLCTTINAQKVTVFKNVQFVDVDKGKIYENAVVLITVNGVATVINKATLAKLNNYNAIDGKGLYLMPALYDMHIHWPEQNELAYFELCKQAGVGNFRVMSSLPAAIEYKKKEKIQGFSIGFPVRAGTNFVNAKLFTDSIKGAGYDFIKIFSISSQDAFIALAKAAQKNNLPLCGHALNNVSIDTVFKYGYKSVEHVGYLDKLSDLALDSAIEKFKKYKVAVCPTLDWQNMAYHAFSKDSFQYRAGYQQGMAVYKTHWDTTYESSVKQMGADEAKYIDFAKKSLEKKLMVLKKLAEKQVPIIIGSDAEEPYQTPGYSLIEELKLIQKAGFTNLQLLQMVTLNAANYYAGIKKTTNTKRNDQFILLAKNPVENIDNLTTVKELINLK